MYKKCAIIMMAAVVAFAVALFLPFFIVASSENTKNDATVIILGGGVAGIQAAAQLTQQGIKDFMIIEQANRIGGRMWNIEWEGVSVELGCNWIEGTPLTENPLWTIAQEIGLKGASTNQEDEPLMFDKKGKEDTAVVKSIWTRLNSAMAAAYRESTQRQWNGLPDLSLREALARNGWVPQTAMEKTAEFFYVEWNFEYGAEDVSLFNFFSSPVGIATKGQSMNTSSSIHRSGSKLKRGMPRNVRAALARIGAVDDSESPEFFVTDSRGYIAVMQYIADSYLSVNDQRLILNTTVTNIQYDESQPTGVTVTSSDGRKFTADYVICTFSAGVINKGDSTGLFSPSLPQWKRKAYARAQMGTYTKVFLKFNEPFWDDWVYTLYADSSKYGYYPVWQNMQALGLFFPNDTNVFMVTVVNSESDRIEIQSDADTIAEAAKVLQTMYGTSKSAATAVDILVPIWEHAPHFLGSYSNIAVGTDGTDFVNMEKNMGGVWFAGEATDWDWNGFVTGAYFSGDRVAKCVAASRKAGRSVPCPQN